MCGCALWLQGCAHPLHWSERERKRERKREIKREIKRERERERERERCKICPKLLLLFLRGMMGNLALFSYLVRNIFINQFKTV